MIKVMLNRNSQPSFGMNLSKDTVKFLKSSAPKLIENDGYTAAKEGINRLVALTNREDGIKAKISTTRFE